MTPDDILEYIHTLGDVLTMRPGPGDGSPEISWGDTFFYYTGDGSTPSSPQPFATIVTKNYPGEEFARLDRPGAFRVNMAAGRTEFIRWTGTTPREINSTTVNYATPDAVLPHPAYASAAWLAVIDPGPHTESAVRDLLRTAHARARTHYERSRDR